MNTPKLKINVAITGLSATDNPAPGIAVIRSLKEEKKFQGKIIGLAYDAMDTGIYDSNLLDEVYLIPYPSEGETSLLHRLKYIIKKTKLKTIIPTLDSELINFCRLQKELENLGVSVLIPKEEQLKMRSKVFLYNFCQQNKFHIPETKIITSVGQISRAILELSFPILVKGIFYEAYTAYSQEEVLVYFNKIITRWGVPIILQKQVIGEEYDVVAVGNKKSKLAGAVAMRKLRITEKGKAWAGITINEKNLLTLAKNILEKLRWVGPIEMEFIKNNKDKNYYLIEINPRFPSWVYLATKAGQNLPYLTLQYALNKKTKKTDNYKTGLTFVRHAVDLVCPISYLESLTTKGELVFREV